MSDGLISREEVLSIITPRLNSSRVGSLEYQRLYSMSEEVKSIDTAYDVERVIQQLEEKISSYELCVETATKEIDKNPQNVSTFEVCSLHNNRGYLNGLKRALEIVKSGGIDAGKKGGV